MNKEQALIDFLNKTCGHYEDRISIEKNSSADWHQIFRSLVKPFGFDIVVLEDSKMTEDTKLYAITKAIRQLKRIGKKPSIISISRIVKMNQWNCRQLMVKYGMFDVDTKEISNYFDDWKDPDF